MKVYVSHSTNYDFTAELYQPLKSITDVDFYFPHDENHDGENSKDIIATCDFVLADVSFPSTGQGIELGWASSLNIPVFCIYRAGSAVSSALSTVSNKIVEYDSIDGLLVMVKERVAS